jgi:glycine cleavage system H lipoate-binding protein
MVALYVLLGFILLLIIDYFVIKGEKKFHPAFQKKYEVVENVVFDNISVTVPADSYVSKGHTWAELLGNGLIKIGVDEFILKSLGKFMVTNLVKSGSVIKNGDVIIQAKLGDKNLSFRSPVDGTVNFVNDDLIGKTLSDPYGDDWGVMVTPINFEKNASSLKANEKVVEWMKNEFIRLKNYLVESSAQPQLAGVTMLDGGKMLEGAVAHLNKESVKKFEDEFLKV